MFDVNDEPLTTLGYFLFKEQGHIQNDRLVTKITKLNSKINTFLFISRLLELFFF